MDLIASFSSQKVNTFHFFDINGILEEDKDLVFLFDPGAACPVIGVNSFFRKDKDINDKIRLERLIKDELVSQNISPRSNPLKAANSHVVKTYPCVCHNVSIEHTAKFDLYFDIAFDEISIPLLGSSFTDDCGYSRAINGNLNITGMKTNPGFDYYKGYNVLDFNVVVRKFNLGN